MPNRRLTADEMACANEVLTSVRMRLIELAGDDQELLFALRRKVAKELTYDERGKPMARGALKKRMRVKQEGLCPLCQLVLPDSYCVLDRFKAIDGYVEGNVRLICEACDRKVQKERHFT